MVHDGTVLIPSDVNGVTLMWQAPVGLKSRSVPGNKTIECFKRSIRCLMRGKIDKCKTKRREVPEVGRHVHEVIMRRKACAVEQIQYHVSCALLWQLFDQNRGV